MLKLLPWLLTATVAVGTPVLLVSGYKPQANDVTVTGVDAQQAEARGLAFNRQLFNSSSTRSQLPN